MEAGAIGLPLVCFRTGGIADLCDDGAGIAVDYPDTAGFAAALGSLLANATDRTRTGERARAVVRSHHDTEVGVARIRAVIDRVLDGARP